MLPGRAVSIHMKTIHMIVGAFACALSSCANAQFIELSITTDGEASHSHLYHEARVVLDTNTQPYPSPDHPNRLRFDLLDGELARIRVVNRNRPFVANSDLVHRPIRLDREVSYLEYNPDLQQLLLSTRTNGLEFILIEMSTVPEDFHPEMTSLPDNAEAYLPIDEPESDIIILGQSSQLHFLWTHEDGVEDSINSVFVRANAIDQLPSYACVQGDLNRDGQINFHDVSIILQAYAAGCP